MRFFLRTCARQSRSIKDKDIFTIEGLQTFIVDMRQVSDFFLHRNFGIKETADDLARESNEAIPP
jgi:hypothetical protein